METTIDERYSRQASMVPQEKLGPCSIIGVGAIGNNVARLLTALGVPRIDLHDYDTVEPHNCTSQGFWESHTGGSKVEATYHAFRRINSSVAFSNIPDRFRPKYSYSETVFCCVDKISIRELIWNHLGEESSFFGDARMHGENMRIIVACDEESKKHYPTTLFPEEESHQGSCTVPGALYTASIAAGLLVNQYIQHLKGGLVCKDTFVNLATCDMYPTE